jgi:tetratricopeptide (TPR) repeat protein
MWFDQADSQDLALLAQYDVWGGVPITPLKLPGLGRYGRFDFDRRLLLQRNDLTIAQRREVIFLSAHFHRIDHFEFFELHPDADVRALKKSFFHFSKRFHPDVVRSMSLGNFSEHVKLVFEYGQQAFELLTTDEVFRKAYARVTKARDLEFLAQLERERELQNQKLTEARTQGRRPPSHMRIGGVPTPAISTPQAPQRSTEEIQKRKSMLRDRLARNKDRRRTAEGSRQDADLRTQAKTFFMAGEQAEKRGQLVRALNHFKLCVEYLPKEQKYASALSRVESALHEQEAQELWASAEKQTRSGDELQKMAAIDLYLRSCQLSATPRRLILLTQHAIEYERVSDILDILHEGVEREPLNLDLKWCLVQCYEARRDLSRARHYIDEMISYDPSEPRALRFQKRYR